MCSVVNDRNIHIVYQRCRLVLGGDMPWKPALRVVRWLPTENYNFTQVVVAAGLTLDPVAPLKAKFDNPPLHHYFTNPVSPRFHNKVVAAASTG